MRSVIFNFLCGLAVLFVAATVKGEADGIEVHHWLGKDPAGKWTDKTNWLDGSVPSFFSFSTAISFDSEVNKRFTFGGEDFELRASTVLFPTNAGTYTITAPIVSVGGSVNENRSDGYILENIFSKGLIENYSSNTQTLSGSKRLRIGWDTTINATNGSVVLKGGVTGPNFRIYKDGPKSLTIADGEVDLRALVLYQGDLVLSNVTGGYYNDGTFTTNYATTIRLEKGAQLKIGNTNKTDTFYVRNMLEMEGTNEAGEPCLIDFQNRSLAILSKEFKIDGGIIDNAGHIRLINGWDGRRYTFEFANGAELNCKGIYVGVADRHFGQIGCSNVTLRVIGGSKDTPTKLNLNGGELFLGTRGGWGDLFSKGSNTIEILGNAQIVGVGKTYIPTDGAPNSRLILNDGAKLETSTLWFGFRGSCVTGVVNGKDTRLDVTNHDLTIGYTDWDHPTTNVLLTISNGAVLNSVPKMYVGQTTSSHAANSCITSNVVVRVIKGGKLRTKGAVIGYANRSKDSCTSVFNKLLVSGNSTAWESTGDTIVVGSAHSSLAANNTITVQDGARVLSKSTIIVGNGAGRPSNNNKFRLLSGSVMRQHENIVVGKNNNSDNQDISDNVFEMRGTAKAKTILQMENKSIMVGYSDKNNRPARNNRFILGPYSELTGVASLNIGMEKHCKNSGNAFVLAGGNALVDNLTICDNNFIELDLATAPKPLLVNKDVYFGEGACIRVANPEKAKPGQYPVLAWKGDSTGIDRIKLDPSMDASRWVLDVRKDRKQIVLYHKN